MMRTSITPRNARDEAEIFDDLQKICLSPGYIHAIAYLCWRDNFIRFAGDQVKEDDLEHQHSHGKLLRSEISTLIGLLAKVNVNTSIPHPGIIQSYVEKSELLLHKMHMSLQKPWMIAFETMARNPDQENPIDPFSTADGLREPIFYSGESAYNFQYIDLARKKYRSDTAWITSRFGFSIDEACLVASKLGNLQIRKISNVRKTTLGSHLDQLTYLDGFIFEAHELQASTGLSVEKIDRILLAFTIDAKRANACFSSLSAFNEINAAPIMKISGHHYILLQHYSLLEALYEAPFFWMVSDKSYAATAAKNRGAFAEQFLADRFTLVFGSQHVFQNVDIYKGKRRVAEADVLVVYGDRAIVVQAKSKRLTLEARKGNDFQLKDDFKKAIHDAYDQALLCSETFRDQECRFVPQSGGEITFARRPKIIFPICSVSDHFPALAAQARQFLKIVTTDNIKKPIITDLFFLDVLTEMLSSPLHFLNYLTLRAKFDDQLIVNQELTTLGYHLKHNLWLEEKYNMVSLGEDFTSSLDIAMSVRRLGIPGARTPKGILTRFEGTPIGKLICQFEANATPEFVGLGMLFLQLGSDAANHINKGVVRLVRSAGDDGRHHDISVPSDADKSGFTIHVNALPEEAARERLLAHCRIRKYDTRSDMWYGLLLAPRTGHVRGILVTEEEWKVDANMEIALTALPKKPMVSIKSLSQGVLHAKVGRNEMCPCGSGKKYKNCCLKQR